MSDLDAFVGRRAGPDQLAPDPVNQPMIRHLVEALGDTNPVYVDEAAAAASVHGQIVAPPTMLQAWVMHGLHRPDDDPSTAYAQMNAALFAEGFTSVVATNCEQTYHRYLHLGDRLTMRTTIESISPRKTTALGTGHFVTTRQDYYADGEELVGTMTFRIFRFRPAPRPAKRPPRPGPATTRDNAFLFEGFAEGRLLIQRCASCATLRHPPGPMCPSCHSLQWDTVEAAGTGTVHSFCVVHYPQIPSFEYPLTVVLVDLDGPGEDGLRVVMNTDHPLQIGEPVRIEVGDVGDGTKLPVAVPAGASA